MFNFSNKFVKIPAQDWEDIKQEMANLRATNETLRQMQSPLLKKKVEELSAQVNQLKIYDAQDEKLYSMEQANQDKLKRIKELEDEVAKANKRAEDAEFALQKEKAATSLFAEYYHQTKDCKNYRTVSKFDAIYA